MQSTRIGIWVITAAVALGLGVFIQERRSDNARTEAEMTTVRTYQVPAARAEELKGVLDRLFWKKNEEAPSGSAQVFGNGLLVVKAPGGLQDGIAGLIAKLSQDSGAFIHDQPHDRFRMDYWIVAGEAATKSNADTMGGLSAVLTSIDKVDGPRNFRVLEHLESTSTVGSEASLKGRYADLKNIARTLNDGVILEFSIRGRETGELASRVFLKKGEYIVLGQNALTVDSDVTKKIRGVEGVGNPPNIYHVFRIDNQS